MENMEKIFRDAIEELDELIEGNKVLRIKLGIKYGIDSEQFQDKNSLIEGFILRKRQTRYLAEKFGIKNI